ncbi:MAG TPA: hypothetical protein VF702_11050 [Allosphingosinicella sp.]|jgi:hypothetical protein
MHGFRIASLYAACVAAPVAAQTLPAVTLSPGEAVTMRLDDGGVVGAPERGRAEWSRFDLYAARQLAGMTPPDAPEPESTPITGPEGVSPDPIPPGEVRLRFFAFNGHGLLVVENGHGGALRYRARMTVNGRARHTDVCVVLPHLPSYEHWPHSVERLELTDFRFIPWVPGRRPTCE